VASLAFFVSFGTLRGITYSIHHNAGPFRNIVIRKVHVHPLVWGVLLLVGVGYLWLAQIGLGVGESSRRASTLMAMLYGVAAGLTLDEFALWLNLEDVYWTRKGRQASTRLFCSEAFCSLGFMAGRFWARLHVTRDSSDRTTERFGKEQSRLIFLCPRARRLCLGRIDTRCWSADVVKENPRVFCAIDDSGLEFALLERGAPDEPPSCGSDPRISE
jgi:hypothetical protein